LENTKKQSPTKLLPFSLVLWMYHNPLAWKEQENLGNKTHFEALLGALWIWVYSRCNLDHKGSARRSYRPVHSSTKPKPQCF